MNRQTLKNMPVIGPLGIALSAFRRKVSEQLVHKKLYLKYKKYLLKNGSLKNTLAGETVFILATGPSVKNQNLKGLAGKHSISVSNFFVHPDFKTINPEFHIFAASHDPITGEQYFAWLKDAEKHFTEKLKVILSVDGAIEETQKIFPNRAVYHYMTAEKPIRIKTDIDLTREAPRIQGVSHLALYYAMYMGAKKIYLLGCDHDRILHVGTSVHFYDQQQHAMVRQGYNEWSSAGDMQARFKANYELWERYKEIKKYADKRGIEIYNSTPGSLLDVFPRKTLEQALEEMKNR